MSLFGKKIKDVQIRGRAPGKAEGGASPRASPGLTRPALPMCIIAAGSLLSPSAVWLRIRHATVLHGEVAGGPSGKILLPD